MSDEAFAVAQKEFPDEKLIGLTIAVMPLTALRLRRQSDGIMVQLLILLKV